ncbi:MAG: hypothetical protein BA863_02465 [Desulfovibrio sp. S3730MH75]|nr:MAG: hypothetical protein BA863_02465 [Desulfovibrio sp. S3730MH75]
MKGQLIPPSVKITIDSPRTNKKTFAPSGPIGGAPARAVLNKKTPLSLSLVIILCCFLLGISIIVHFFKTSPVSIIDYGKQVVKWSKSVVSTEQATKSDYELIASIPEGVATRYEEEAVYCWADAKGKIHYSNIGFPLTGKYEKKWVRRE